MYLSDALSREKNNLDLIRLFAACLVIYGHANAFLPTDSRVYDFVARWLIFEYSGSLAVKIFFFLSGLVVANSFFRNGSVIHFFLARIFRIWPALIFVLLMMAFVIGPIVTNVPFKSYIYDNETYSYVYKNILMRATYNLPGVFSGNIGQAVNGSLWTLSYEVKSYLFFISIAMIGVFRVKFFVWLIFAISLIYPFNPFNVFFDREINMEIDMLLPCFFSGVLMAFLKDKIKLSIFPVFGFLILFFIFKGTKISYYMFYAFLFFGILYFSTRPLIVSWRLPADVSYGVYLWGWPVQQILIHYFPGINPFLYVFTSVLISIIIGSISWFFIEKYAINFGGYINEKIKQKILLLN